MLEENKSKKKHWSQKKYTFVNTKYCSVFKQFYDGAIIILRVKHRVYCYTSVISISDLQRVSLVGSWHHKMETVILSGKKIVYET